jgi:hypothetical protein
MMTYINALSSINNKLSTGTLITADRHRQVEKDILDFVESQWLIGDIKKIDCTDDYIAANFVGGSGPTEGLGINEREGWAICNGKNGTRNRTGRVSVAVGWGVPPIGGTTDTLAPSSVGSSINTPVTGGSKDAILVKHNHTFSPSATRRSQEIGTNGDGTHECTQDFILATGDALNSNGAVIGVSGTNKNMQPYIVTLFIQKIS